MYHSSMYRNTMPVILFLFSSFILFLSWPQFTGAVTASTQDSEDQGPKIRVNTITISGENGTISKITNTSQIVQGYDGVVKLLQNQTANTYSPDARGIIINKLTGMTLIAKDLNSTNYGVADEIRKTVEIQKFIPGCWIEVEYSNGIPIIYLCCVGTC
jgi:hypothetical protein